jgi:hypothetical protein
VTAHPVRDLLGFLRGGRIITRQIEDGRNDAFGRLDGIARFAPTPFGLCYDEEGELTLGAHRGTASQRYLFASAGSGMAGRPAMVEVRFADGRPFYSLDLASGAAAVTHACGDDYYRGRYRVLDDNRFILAWRVSGPRKRLRLATRFVRSAVSALAHR